MLICSAFGRYWLKCPVISTSFRYNSLRLNHWSPRLRETYMGGVDVVNTAWFLRVAPACQVHHQFMTIALRDRRYEVVDVLVDSRGSERLYRFAHGQVVVVRKEFLDEFRGDHLFIVNLRKVWRKALPRGDAGEVGYPLVRPDLCTEAFYELSTLVPKLYVLRLPYEEPGDAAIKQCLNDRFQAKRAVAQKRLMEYLIWFEVCPLLNSRRQFGTPIADYRKYCMWRILAPYLADVKRLSRRC